MLPPEKFSGVLTPVITPFNEDLSVNSDRLIAQCRWIISQEVGLAIFGTNSEANSLSIKEKIELLDELVENGIDPKKMMPGTGCCSLFETIELTTHAINLGVSGSLLLPPFYYKGVSDEGLYASYSEIIERIGSSNFRIYLYNIPPVSNIPISINLIDRLIKNYPNTVVGIKDSSGDWGNTKDMLDQKWDDFRVFVGSETFLLNNMRNGGSGCISATANVNPAAIRHLYQSWDNENAPNYQDKLDEVRNIFQEFPMIPALKAAAAIYSNDREWNRVRPPLLSLNKIQFEKLKSNLREIKFSMPGLSKN